MQSTQLPILVDVESDPQSIRAPEFSVLVQSMVRDAMHGQWERKHPLRKSDNNVKTQCLFPGCKGIVKYGKGGTRLHCHRHRTVHDVKISDASLGLSNNDRIRTRHYMQLKARLCLQEKCRERPTHGVGGAALLCEQHARPADVLIAAPVATRRPWVSHRRPDGRMVWSRAELDDGGPRDMELIPVEMDSTIQSDASDENRVEIVTRSTT